MSDPRYDGKPFLRLVECYVQRAIGALGASDAELLTQMTPKLRATFKQDGEWHEIVAAAMEFDAAFDGWLEAEWAKARAAGVTPERFSQLVSDRVIEE